MRSGRRRNGVIRLPVLAEPLLFRPSPGWIRQVFARRTARIAPGTDADCQGLPRHGADFRARRGPPAGPGARSGCGSIARSVLSAPDGGANLSATR